MEETVTLKLKTYNDLLSGRKDDSLQIVLYKDASEVLEKENTNLVKKLDALLNGMIKKERLLDDYWVKAFTENPQSYAYLFFEVEIEYLLSAFSKEELIAFVQSKIGIKEE